MRDSKSNEKFKFKITFPSIRNAGVPFIIRRRRIDFDLGAETVPDIISLLIRDEIEKFPFQR
jgi:hypothetical protein